jgi:hypothetical protein
MKVFFADGTIDDETYVATIKVGAHITASVSPTLPPLWGTVSPTDTCVARNAPLTLVATPTSSQYVFDY